MMTLSPAPPIPTLAVETKAELFAKAPTGFDELGGGGLPQGRTRLIVDTRNAAFNFRLYIAGDAVNSTHALANLHALCCAHLEGRHNIEVIDVFSEPERALADGIFMTPTLIKLAPSPSRKIVGTLSDAATLMQALELPEVFA